MQEWREYITSPKKITKRINYSDVLMKYSASSSISLFLSNTWNWKDTLLQKWLTVKSCQTWSAGSSEILIRKYQLFFEVIYSFRFLTNPTALSYLIQKIPENEALLAKSETCFFLWWLFRVLSKLLVKFKFTTKILYLTIF